MQLTSTPAPTRDANRDHWIRSSMYYRLISEYRISANSFRGNYSFLKLFVQRSQYISIKFPLHKPSENRGNYSREETIQGRKLFAEIRYLLRKFCFFTLLNLCCGKYSREETIQGRKLYEEIRYIVSVGGGGVGQKYLATLRL